MSQTREHGYRYGARDRANNSWPEWIVQTNWWSWSPEFREGYREGYEARDEARRALRRRTTYQ